MTHSQSLQKLKRRIKRIAIKVPVYAFFSGIMMGTFQVCVIECHSGWFRYFICGIVFLACLCILCDTIEEINNTYKTKSEE